MLLQITDFSPDAGILMSQVLDCLIADLEGAEVSALPTPEQPVDAEMPDPYLLACNLLDR